MGEPTHFQRGAGRQQAGAAQFKGIDLRGVVRLQRTFNKALAEPADNEIRSKGGRREAVSERGIPWLECAQTVRRIGQDQSMSLEFADPLQSIGSMSR